MPDHTDLSIEEGDDKDLWSLEKEPFSDEPEMEELVTECELQPIKLDRE